MDAKQSRRADIELRHAVIAFEQTVLAAPDQPAPALPAFVGLLRAVGGWTRFALDLAFDGDRSDPINLQPKILRAS